ncbi:MAG: 50S ribosomal protein L18e [Candidatus Micrarchaeota archaeon]|nr:50S ribosomal protein L18e [Candidatus Micrarchaeota archaeon]
MKKEKFSEKNLKISAEIPAQARKTLFWKRVLELLSASSRRRNGVNVSRIAMYAKPGSTVVVPDKVLGSGQAMPKLSVAAVSFSATARKMIEISGGKAMSIVDAAKANPTGKEMIIIK